MFRELWQTAIQQQILLNRMHRENLKIQGQITHWLDIRLGCLPCNLASWYGCLKKFRPMVIGCVLRTARSFNLKLCRPAYFYWTTKLLPLPRHRQRQVLHIISIYIMTVCRIAGIKFDYLDFRYSARYWCLLHKFILSLANNLTRKNNLFTKMFLQKKLISVNLILQSLELKKAVDI